MSREKVLAELRMAQELQRSGAAKEAADIYQVLLKRDPKNFDLNHLLGMALIQTGKYDLALPRLQMAVKLNTASVAALSNLGVAYHALERYDDAVDAYARASTLRPDLPDPHARRAAVLMAAGRREDAALALEAAIALKPDPRYLNDYGAVLRDLGRPDAALESLARAIAAQPAYVAAHINCGNVLRDLGRAQDAIAAFDRALALHPDHPDALLNKARAIEEAHGPGAAAEQMPDIALDGSNTSREEARTVKLVSNALLEYARLFAINPDEAMLPEIRLHIMMQLCDWSEYGTVPDMLVRMRTGKIAIQPFPLVALPATARDQMLCAQTYAARKYPLRPPLWKGERYGHDKIRIAYLSADFHLHATAHLMAGLFEAHSRDDFEWTAISTGATSEATPMRQRLEKAFDTFVEAKDMSDEDISQLIRDREIDILVDLKGFTRDARFGVMTRRCAPVQVTWLGYPGTTGSPAVDYAIADRHVVPPEIEPYFTEKIIFMPHSYQVNDNKREIAAHRPSRRELGLPEQGFVFCSFNHNYKITPDTFDIWMRILARVPDSVLWLYRANDTAERNLRAAAQDRGIDPARLFFAGPVPQAEHLARLSAADLFLDNLPCNAHTTASDALWAGLPVLSCPGNTFAGRVASSLLHAVGMPEMVAPTLEEYEELAVSLALDPEKMQAMREKLAANRLTQPLFDTPLFAKHIENAYRVIHQRQQDGQPHAALHIPL